METTQKEMEQRILSIVREFLVELEASRALQGISLDASLERDIGIDSLGKVELFHRIETQFSVRFPERAMVEVDSLHDLVNIIEQCSGKLPEKQAQTFSPILDIMDLDVSSAKTLVDVLIMYAATGKKRPHLFLQNEHGEEQTISYGQLLDEAEAIARGLHKRGIQPGEAVAIMLPTSDEFFYTYCGILLVGAVPIPIYPPFRPDRIEEYAQREAKILHNAEARMLITFAQAKTLSRILRTFVPSMKEVTTVNDLKVANGFLPKIDIDPQDAALIQYTSGSTGEPKGVVLSHQNMLSNMRGIGAAIPIRPTDVGVSWLPLYHDMGLMNWLAAMYFGIPAVILSPLTFLTRPERWLWAIHYHRGTLSGAPNFAYELCVKKINPKDIEGLDLSSWRYAFNGAEAVNPKTLAHFSKKFAPYGFSMESFAPVYGLAESTVGLVFPPQRRAPRIDRVQRDIFANNNHALPSKDNDGILEFVSCGSPMALHNIRIVDDKDNAVQERFVGNVQFNGPSAMQGYFNNPKATKEAYHNGWWGTGDLGYLADNELFITGRKKDLIIKAGRNLYPEEVEEIVGQIPQIRRGCVIAFGVHDANTGTEKLIVVAETYELQKESQQRIRAEIIEKMAVILGIPPDTVILVPPKTVPKTSSGKLRRSTCKQDYLEGKLIKNKLPAKWQFIKLFLLSAKKKIDGGFSYLGKLVYTIYIGIMLFFTLAPIWLGVMLLPCSIATKITRFWARHFFRLAMCPIKIEGEINLQNEIPMIFVSNHASYIDALLLLGILPSGVVFTSKKELLQTPIIRTFIKKLGYLTVDRLDFVKSIENKNQMEETILKKNSVVIFPEGTFTYATGLRPFKLGAFTVAVDTQTAICPIAIKGTRSILRGNRFLLRPGVIKITLGRPIVPKSKEWSETMRLYSMVRSEIAKHCGEPVIDLVVAGFEGD